jgi:hypothetical protein
MPGYLKASPVFDIGYVEVPAAHSDEPWRFATPGYEDLELILRAETREDGAVLQLFFSPAAWSAERVEELSETLREVLSLAAADPGLPVGDLPLALPARPGKITGHSLSAPQFNF